MNPQDEWEARTFRGHEATDDEADDLDIAAMDAAEERAIEEWKYGK